jgi:hypothetical protein
MPLPVLFYSHRESFSRWQSQSNTEAYYLKITIDNFERLFYNVDNIEYLF